MSNTPQENDVARRRRDPRPPGPGASEAAKQFFAPDVWTPQREAEWEGHRPREMKYYLRIKRRPVSR